MRQNQSARQDLQCGSRHGQVNSAAWPGLYSAAWPGLYCTVQSPRTTFKKYIVQCTLYSTYISKEVRTMADLYFRCTIFLVLGSKNIDIIQCSDV